MVKQQTGFTLIEVIVALVIAAISLTATITTLNSHTNLYNKLYRNYYQHNIGWNKLLIYAHPNTTQILRKKNGSVDILSTSWDWQIREQNTKLPSVSRVTIDVVDAATKVGGTIYTTLIYKTSM